MASFSQLMAQLEARQRLSSNLSSSSLGMDVEEEAQDLEAARSDYYEDVEESRRKMDSKSRKRGFLGALGTGLGFASSFLPAINPFAASLIGGLASSLGRASVSPYSGTISSSLPGGKFHSQARKDFSADIASTNQFISDANEGQSLLNMTNALNDAINVYGLTESFGEDARDFFAKGKERRAMRGLEDNYGDDIQERLLGNTNV